MSSLGDKSLLTLSKQSSSYSLTKDFVNMTISIIKQKRRILFGVVTLRGGVFVMLAPDDNSALDLLDEPAFLPATITRAETALSKYPVHNLSKTDRIKIHIRRKGETGEADIQWTVSPSREYGEPRQLAYKVDTLIVNRRTDEAGRPIPRIIDWVAFVISATIWIFHQGVTTSPGCVSRFSRMPAPL